MKNVGIAINKSLLKVYNDEIVYLKNGQEFQIMIFNPYQFKIGARISLNGETIPNALIIKPGERIWLDRYLHCDNKFKFSTYIVEDSYAAKQAILKNGKVKIDFYRIKQPQTNSNYIINDALNNSNIRRTNIQPNIQPNITWQTSISPNSNCSQLTSNCLYSNTITSASFNTCLTSNKIETGLIEEGSKSSQAVEYVNDELEFSPFESYNILIKPYSEKPIYKNDIQRKYCYNCGKRLNSKYKYCPQCGTKIE